MEKQRVKILYKNWKNETRIRTIQPVCIVFKSTEWHPEEQWILVALDIEKNEIRNFAVKDIKEWRVENG